VWNGPTGDFEQFALAVHESFVLIDAAAATGGTDRPFPILVPQTDNLEDAKGAYDFYLPSGEEVAAQPESSNEQIESAVLLEDAVLDITGDGASSGFALTVGLDGASAGVVGCSVTKVRNGIALRFGVRGVPTDFLVLQRLLDALNTTTDLATIHYRSGHVIDTNGIYASEVRTMPFNNWVFEDFAGYSICEEKPPFKKAQEIHDAIGLPGDSSLFSWVVQKYSDGWLTCDDGSGEVSDFVHIAPSGAVSLIHVKGASSNSPLRSIAVGAYEEVASQASKNLIYMNRERLSRELASCPLERPATWISGQRAESRSEFLDMLSATDSSDPFRIVVVQPHVSEEVRRRMKADPSLKSGLARLHRLESLLNAARGAAVSQGAEFEVIGSMA
jgi:hypothetical protein